MGILTQMHWPTTTLLELLNDAEQSDQDLLDVVHLELNDGRDYLMAVVSGERAQRAAELLERLRTWSKPAPADAPAVAHTNDEDVLNIVELLQEWHRTRIEKLQLVANAGPDVKIEARGPDGQPLVLTGQLRAGFQEGANLALQMFDKFPLTVEENGADLDEEE
ncbi:hypothetical protein D9M70_448010 [compost metagenome]